MTAVTPLPTRPFDDSTDSLLRFAMRLDATLSGLVGLFIALMADPLSSLTGLSSIAEFSGGALLVLGGLAVYGLAAAPDLRRVGVGLIVGNIVLTVAALVVVAVGALPLTASRRRRDAGHRRLLRADGIPAIPRSASPAGVTPVPPVRGAAVRGCGERPRIGLLAI